MDADVAAVFARDDMLTYLKRLKEDQRNIGGPFCAVCDEPPGISLAEAFSGNYGQADLFSCPSDSGSPCIISLTLFYYGPILIFQGMGSANGARSPGSMIF